MVRFSIISRNNIAADEAEIATLEKRINQTIYRPHELIREEIGLMTNAERRRIFERVFR